MTQTRTRVLLVLILLLSMISCDRFNGSSNVAKPTQVVDLASMAGKSLLEMTMLLGQARQQVLCYHWDLPEGELGVCYGGDNANKRMSSIDYELKPQFGVGSLEEMMTLINIDVQGKEAEKDRRGFFTYKNLSLNGKSCFVDVHPPAKTLLFGQREPTYTSAHLYIHNPHIYLHSSPDLKGKETIFYEQQTNIDLSVGSVLLGYGDWEVCTDVNFTGKCKILDGIDSEYLKNSKNFSAFGLGNTIRSLRPVKIR